MENILEYDTQIHCFEEDSVNFTDVVMTCKLNRVLLKSE